MGVSLPPYTHLQDSSYIAYLPGPFSLQNMPQTNSIGNQQEKNGLVYKHSHLHPYTNKSFKIFILYSVLCGASGFCCWNLGFSGFNFVFLLLSVWFGFC